MNFPIIHVNFHDYFLRGSLKALCNRSMIAFARQLMVLTCSWLGFNIIIVLHTNLFEVTFEFSHSEIFKDNKLILRLTSQSGVMKQILDGCC
jgi:hypothetical protein